MLLTEKEIGIPVVNNHVNLISHITDYVDRTLAADEIPVRLSITRTNAKEYQCELGILSENDQREIIDKQSIFNFKKRK